MYFLWNTTHYCAWTRVETETKGIFFFFWGGGGGGGGVHVKIELIKELIRINSPLLLI